IHALLLMIGGQDIGRSSRDPQQNERCIHGRSQEPKPDAGGGSQKQPQGQGQQPAAAPSTQQPEGRSLPSGPRWNGDSVRRPRDLDRGQRGCLYFCERVIHGPASVSRKETPRSEIEVTRKRGQGGSARDRPDLARSASSSRNWFTFQYMD